MIDTLNGMMGILILAFGRRLFWLFVGCAGFAVGLLMAQLYFGLEPAWVAWAVALGFGVIGALLAVFFQTIAIGLGGFAAGCTITAYLLTLMGIPTAPVLLLFGGIIGAILLYTVFDWALIGLSSVAGATLIVQALNWNPQAEMVLYAALIVAGILFQTAMLRRQQHQTK